MAPVGREGANTALGDAALLVSYVERAEHLGPAVGAHREMCIAVEAAFDRSAGFAAQAHHVVKEASHA